MKGKVYLVGAGPGDPELLTLKALRLLQNGRCRAARRPGRSRDPEADSRRRRRFTTSASAAARRRFEQEEINFLMVALADSGLRVVRLKSGDPLIFGRAGEEIESLRRANIPYEIVPGVTSAWARQPPRRFR